VGGDNPTMENKNKKKKKKKKKNNLARTGVLPRAGALHRGAAVPPSRRPVRSCDRRSVLQRFPETNVPKGRAAALGHGKKTRSRDKGPGPNSRFKMNELRRRRKAGVSEGIDDCVWAAKGKEIKFA